MILPKKLLQKCPVCSQEYDYQKIKILETEDLYVLSYLQCTHCSSGVILKILILPHGLVGQAVLTDLSEEEIKQLKKNKGVIESSDVLFVYDFFKKQEDLIKNLKD